MICCSLCDRSHHGRVPFLCAVDARNRLYPLRVQNARALIENEELERTVGEEEASKKPYLDRLKSEMAAANARTAEIMAQCERLKRQAEQTRKEVEKKKDVLARKESDLSAMSTGVAARRNRQLEETQESIRRIRFKWAACADTMVSTRSFLCEEAARLFGLRQIRKGSSKRYELGGVEIIDLHALNSELAHFLPISPSVSLTYFFWFFCRPLTRGYQHFPGQHHSFGDADLPLSRHSASFTNHTSTPRLPTTDNFMAAGVLSIRGAAVSGSHVIWSSPAARVGWTADRC